MIAPALAPWIERPFGLVSLKEIVALMTGSDEWPSDRIILGPLANTIYGLGSLQHGRLDAKSALQVSFFLGQAADSLEAWGFAATCGAFRDLAELIDGTYVQGGNPLYGPESIPTFITMARQSLMYELEARVFLPVDPERARFYREPMRDWEAVAARFPDATTDIEEAGKCYALRRNAACVFHSMQIVEHGLLALGRFMQINDPKSGFTAVANELDRVLKRPYPERTEFERIHYAFFQQVNAPINSMRDAWRNKISHAQGALTLLTSDFNDDVAHEIYTATRGFMRRLEPRM